jgi:crotonobetainyl-CoA:carnitine CoA-transferase CaiB-like acyl-CoA transferase
MHDTMIGFLWPEAMTQYTVVGREASTADPIARPDLIFETADDYIAVGTISDSEWRGFCAGPNARTSSRIRASAPPARAPATRPNGFC